MQTCSSFFKIAWIVASLCVIYSPSHAGHTTSIIYNAGKISAALTVATALQIGVDAYAAEKTSFQKKLSRGFKASFNHKSYPAKYRAVKKKLFPAPTKDPTQDTSTTTGCMNRIKETVEDNKTFGLAVVSVIIYFLGKTRCGAPCFQFLYSKFSPSNRETPGEPAEGDIEAPPQAVYPSTGSPLEGASMHDERSRRARSLSAGSARTPRTKQPPTDKKDKGSRETDSPRNDFIALLTPVLAAGANLLSDK
jgi:hypothetical protein